MTEIPGRRIFHLVAAEPDMSGPDRNGVEQLERHGFVHCCTREQIIEIASWWLKGVAPLEVVEIDADRAGDVRFEPADLGRRYPHVYNAVPDSAIVGVHRMKDPAVLPAPLASPAPAFRVAALTHDRRSVELFWSAGALSGDDRVVEAARTLDGARSAVMQFPAIDAPADLSTAYGAFCVIHAVVDEIVAYAGDGFTLEKP